MGILARSRPPLIARHRHPELFLAGGKRRHFPYTPGFVEVVDNHVRVLADVAERQEEIDVQRAKAASAARTGREHNPALGGAGGCIGSQPTRAGPSYDRGTEVTCRYYSRSCW